MANKLRLPLVAVYGLYEGFPEANERCFSFLIDGLVDLRDGLMARGVPLALLRCPPPEAALRLGKEAALIVCDCGCALTTTANFSHPLVLSNPSLQQV